MAPAGILRAKVQTWITQGFLWNLNSHLCVAPPLLLGVSPDEPADSRTPQLAVSGASSWVSSAANDGVQSQPVRAEPGLSSVWTDGWRDRGPGDTVPEDEVSSEPGNGS